MSTVKNRKTLHTISWGYIFLGWVAYPKQDHAPLAPKSLTFQRYVTWVAMVRGFKVTVQQCDKNMAHLKIDRL